MNHIEVSINEDICSCNGCFAKNYASANEQAVQVYDVQVGSVVVHMCRECMAKLSDAITQACAIAGESQQGAVQSMH